MKTKRALVKWLLIVFAAYVLLPNVSFSQLKVGGRTVVSGLWNGRAIQYAAGEIAIKLRSGASSRAFAQLLNQYHGTLKHGFDPLGWGWVSLPDTSDVMSVISALQRDSIVQEAEPNFVTHVHVLPNDPYFNGTSPATYSHQWALKNTGQTSPSGTPGADIDATDAWNITTGSSSVIIAILDTGIPMQNGSLSHPDLSDANRIILGPDESGSGEGDEDLYGHGTHVTGIAAAESNNGTGIAGIDWNSKIMVVKVFGDDGTGLDSWFYNGVVYAVNYIRNNPGYQMVINYSGGQSTASSYMESAVSYANQYNVTIVASAGNDYGGPVVYPAAYSSSYVNVIAVSATDQNDNFSSYSNEGSQIDVAAPGGYGVYSSGGVTYYNGPNNTGENIFSTEPNYPFNLQSMTDCTENYGYLAGTSMAAPQVTGTVGLMLSVDPSLTPSQIRTILENTAAKVPGMDGQNFTNQYGYGRLDAYRAVGTLFVPLVYPTIASALSAAVNTETVNVSGAQTVSSNLTVPSGVTLQINPGATITFSGYYKLRIEGALYASGSSSSPITFQGSGSPGSWFGIEFYDISQGSALRYCTIKDATYGLNLISSYLPANPLDITNNDYGVNCTNYSDPSFTSTVFSGNNYDVYGDATSTPLLGTSTGPGYNSFRNPGIYQVYSTYSGTISAEGNWWGSSPASPYVTSNVDYSNWLSSDPNPEMKEVDGKHVVVVQSVSSSSSEPQISQPKIASSDTSITKLDEAYRLYLGGDYKDALQAFETVTTSYPNDFAACRALVFTERCLDKLGESSGVLTELNDVSAARTGTKVGTFAEARRTYQYLDQGKYQEALAQAVQTAGSSNDSSLVKFALYDAGSINWYDLGNKGNGEKYYRQLISRFPGDPLSASALVAMGESTSPSASQQQADTLTVEKRVALGNYPNPFNPTTVINYQLPKDSHVTLKVYDVLGREVATLVNSQISAGYHQAIFDGSDYASGVYFYRLTTPSYTKVMKMLLVK